MTARRVLVAAVGNVLRGDDGFGPAVIQALRSATGVPEGLHAAEVGIGGVSLVHELMDGYDALVLVDAVDRGGAPGSLYVLEPEVPDVMAIPALERRELAADMHQAVPGPALVMARAVGALPPIVRIVGCQPVETEEFCTELSPPVREAVPKAVEAILSFLLNPNGQQNGSHEEVRNK
jgi:hydrogenase maturation protease